MSTAGPTTVSALVHPSGLVPVTAELRTATWNINRNPHAWGYLHRLRDDHGVQVVHLQEAVPPPDPARWAFITPDPFAPELWKVTVPPGFRRNYASAIVALDPALDVSAVVPTPLALAPPPGHGLGWTDILPISHPGQFAVARFSLAGWEMASVCVYGLWDYLPWSSPVPSLHRAISDLGILFQDPNVEVTLAGDLNIFRNTNNEGQAHFDTVFDRLAVNGMALVGPLRAPDDPPLEGCTCGQGPGCTQVETYRCYRPNARPYCDDYIFASAGLAPLTCTAVHDPVIRERHLSDHWPVVATLALRPRPVRSPQF